MGARREERREEKAGREGGGEGKGCRSSTGKGRDGWSEQDSEGRTRRGIAGKGRLQRSSLGEAMPRGKTRRAGEMGAEVEVCGA